MTQRQADPEVFKSRLREIMKDKGIHQKDLVDKSGISKFMIEQYCAPSTGKVPAGQNLQKIADALGVSPEWLLGRSAFRTHEEEEQTTKHISKSVGFRRFTQLDERFNYYFKALESMGYDTAPLFRKVQDHHTDTFIEFIQCLHRIDDELDQLGKQYCEKKEPYTIDMELFTQKMKDAGVTLDQLCDQLGMTVEEFQIRAKGKKFFKAYDIAVITNTLHLDTQDMSQIFFS